MSKTLRKITPFLWFDHEAEEAANFYISTFNGSSIDAIARYGAGGPGPKGSVMTVTFTIEGQQFIALNGGPHYKINEAISFMIYCDTQAEIDDLWQKLGSGGKEIQCGWLRDKYGVTWQIIPAVLDEMMQDKNEERHKRVIRAMMKMVKLDIAGLQKAYDGH